MDVSTRALLVKQAPAHSHKPRLPLHVSRADCLPLPPLARRALCPQGDFTAALNISAVHACPALYLVRNNGYAISTTTREQYASDGVAPRGVAFGVPTIRVDGNDAIAVYTATAQALPLLLRASPAWLLVLAAPGNVPETSQK